MGNISITKVLIFVVIPLLVIGASISVAYYYYNQYQQTQLLLKNPQQAAKIEAKSLVAEVGKYMELPAKEEPTLATVTDAAKLKDQPFFVRAKNGDKVLMYIETRQAILYRPSTNKIIAVAPISINEEAEPQGNVAGETTQISPTVPLPSLTPSPTTRSTLPTFTPAPTR